MLKMVNNILLSYLIINLSFIGIFGYCPAEEMIRPCVCLENMIYCGGYEPIDLGQMFEKMSKKLPKSEKNFNYFQLNNTAITVLEDYTFSDITFNVISIKNCTKLTTIQTHAFFETQLVTKLLILKNNPELCSPDNSIFDILSKFVNIEVIQVKHNKIAEIPSHAFKKLVGYQDKLRKLYFYGPAINRIGSYAFNVLRNLEHLFIHRTTIKELPDKVFAFNEESKNDLVLSLIDNEFNGLQANTFANLNHPTNLILENRNPITYLNETVFRIYFEQNARNNLSIPDQFLDCKTCNNVWLKNNTAILKRVNYPGCSNANRLEDESNFFNCGPKPKVEPSYFVEEDNSIRCTGSGPIDLKKIFHDIPTKLLTKVGKHFSKLIINNTFIKELEENTSNDLTFDEIIVENCTNLTTINKNAFTATNLVTRILSIKNVPALKLSNTYQIFEVFSKFINLEHLDVDIISLREIPSNAFKILIGYQNKLERIDFRLNLDMIGSQLFYNLNNLKHLSFEWPVLAKKCLVTDFAFEFRRFSNTTLEIFFNADNLDKFEFNGNSLIKMRRPTRLYFNSKMTHLDENVFLPFLLDHPNNEIILNLNSIDCNECRNNWMKTHPHLIPRLGNAKCLDGNSIPDQDNFKNCSNILK